MRNGEVCESCVAGIPERILLHRCYGDSLLKSYLALRLYRETRSRALLDPWVDAYIALSHFGRDLFVKMGIDPTKTWVKPNFAPDHLSSLPAERAGTRGAVFDGRLSREKGVSTLLRAWRGIDYPLDIVGDGPLRSELAAAAPSQARFLGWLPRDEVIRRVHEATFLVFPSLWYEGFGMSLIEAMSLAKPVIASDLGPRRELVTHGKTGLLYEADDVDALRRAILQLIHRPELRAELAGNARLAYEASYTASTNYDLLLRIYRGNKNEA
jgi:glycosyltransferase involved in cell wall biosynthesis